MLDFRKYVRYNEVHKERTFATDVRVLQGERIMREESRHIHRNTQSDRRRQNSRIRRVRQLRRRIMTAFVALVLSLTIGILGCSFFSKAQSEDAVVEYKYFTSIQVKAGDTLYSIAQEYADSHYASVYDYMEEICLTNHLLDEKINTGDYLIIPYYCTEFR